MRPPAMLRILSNIIAAAHVWSTVKSVIQHAAGRLSAEEQSFVPETEWRKVTLVARIWLLMHLSVIALALWLQSWLPLMYVGVLPTMYGGWLTIYFGLTRMQALPTTCLTTVSTRAPST